ncbi:MAG TPA: class I tRNA ligase family protein [Acidimicrobiia bacterium]|nr:class I tRNA ligase family protein [Acidimicrobiia bacterium]
MPTLHLYDSTDEAFHDVIFTDRASIYTCGVTPYDSSHLGHIATFIYFDIVRRLLISQGVNVSLVRNITDLDDPLFERVRDSEEPLETLVARNIEQLDKDLDLLNCLPPTHEPYSSEYVDDMIAAITKLLENGHAYTVDGWTYFDTSSRASFPEFEAIKKMGEQSIEELGAQRGANPDDSRMKSRLDFVLWKPSADDEPSFDAPFGVGRPGWHIECSVMAMKLLGNTIDIHGGGDDLIFPHHACEVAQSESLSHEPFVRHFMHVAPVAYEGTKMSKSLGNLVYADEIIQEIGARCTRMMILAHHYREGYEHHDTDAGLAQERCARWTKVMATFEGDAAPGVVYQEVLELLRNDLDTPGSLKVLDTAISAFSFDDIDAEQKRADIQAAKELLGL